MGLGTNGESGNKAAIVEILAKHPFHHEEFIAKGGMMIEADVARDDNLRIIYVRRGSVHEVTTSQAETPS